MHSQRKLPFPRPTSKSKCVAWGRECKLCQREICLSFFQVTVQASIEHPFFVFGQGWSSVNPERTLSRYRLPCKQLKVGDICISLTHRHDPSSTTNVSGSEKSMATEDEESSFYTSGEERMMPPPPPSSSSKSKRSSVSSSSTSKHVAFSDTVVTLPLSPSPPPPVPTTSSTSRSTLEHGENSPPPSDATKTYSEVGALNHPPKERDLSGSPPSSSSPVQHSPSGKRKPEEKETDCAAETEMVSQQQQNRMRDVRRPDKRIKPREESTSEEKSLKKSR